MPSPRTTSRRLTLYQHPLASYCQKALVALYELQLPFETYLIEGEEGRAQLAALWPIASMPVLRDDVADLLVPESPRSSSTSTASSPSDPG